MTFIQLIDFESDRETELEALIDSWRGQTEGQRFTANSITSRDRDRPDHYVVIVEFDSFEQAMKNSNLPETQQFAAKMAELCKGAPRFTNLDEIRRDKA
jgi:quinol monooxygenase YgiN